MDRLVGAVLAEQNDEWTESCRYMGVEILAACRKAARPAMGQDNTSEAEFTVGAIPAQMEIGREVAISYTISEDVAGQGSGSAYLQSARELVGLPDNLGEAPIYRRLIRICSAARPSRRPGNGASAITGTSRARNTR